MSETNNKSVTPSANGNSSKSDHNSNTKLPTPADVLKRLKASGAVDRIRKAIDLKLNETEQVRHQQVVEKTKSFLSHSSHTLDNPRAVFNDVQKNVLPSVQQLIYKEVSHLIHYSDASWFRDIVQPEFEKVISLDSSTSVIDSAPNTQTVSNGSGENNQKEEPTAAETFSKMLDSISRKRAPPTKRVSLTEKTPATSVHKNMLNTDTQLKSAVEKKIISSSKPPKNKMDKKPRSNGAKKLHSGQNGRISKESSPSHTKENDTSDEKEKSNPESLEIGKKEDETTDDLSKISSSPTKQTPVAKTDDKNLRDQETTKDKEPPTLNENQVQGDKSLTKDNEVMSTPEKKKENSSTPKKETPTKEFIDELQREIFGQSPSPNKSTPAIRKDKSKMEPSLSNKKEIDTESKNIAKSDQKIKLEAKAECPAIEKPASKPQGTGSDEKKSVSMTTERKRESIHEKKENAKDAVKPNAIAMNTTGTRKSQPSSNQIRLKLISKPIEEVLRNKRLLDSQKSLEPPRKDKIDSDIDNIPVPRKESVQAKNNNDTKLHSLEKQKKLINDKPTESRKSQESSNFLASSVANHEKPKEKLARKESIQNAENNKSKKRLSSNKHDDREFVRRDEDSRKMKRSRSSEVLDKKADLKSSIPKSKEDDEEKNRERGGRESKSRRDEKHCSPSSRDRSPSNQIDRVAKESSKMLRDGSLSRTKRPTKSKFRKRDHTDTEDRTAEDDPPHMKGKTTLGKRKSHARESERREDKSGRGHGNSKDAVTSKYKRSNEKRKQDENNSKEDSRFQYTWKKERCVPEELETQKKLIPILQKLLEKPHADPFAFPVDPKDEGCHDYYDEIKNPMDISTIITRLDNSTPTEGFYKTVSEVLRDINRIWENCMTFNSHYDPICGDANKCKADLDVLLESINITSGKGFRTKRKESFKMKEARLGKKETNLSKRDSGEETEEKGDDDNNGNLVGKSGYGFVSFDGPRTWQSFTVNSYDEKTKSYQVAWGKNKRITENERFGETGTIRVYKMHTSDK